MKKTLSILFVITIFIQALSLFGCAGQKEKFTYSSFEYFDTVTTIVGYEKNKEAFDKLTAEICAELESYHKLYDIYNEYEGTVNLYTINHTEGPVKADRKIIDLLLYAKNLNNSTAGAFNIAMGSVLSIWHEYRERASNAPQNAELPPYELLTEASAHTDIDDIIIDEKEMTVMRQDSELKIDVGGLAKGYAAEMTAKMLEERGIEGYLLNLGGNVRAIGSKPDGKPWNVGIENPDSLSDEAYIAQLEIESSSLVTSGSYQRYYEYNGKRYHHIIDPKTLMPSEYYLSVSVHTKDSALADALSTALFVTPYKEGLALVEALEGVEAMWVFNNNEKKYSNGFKS